MPAQLILAVVIRWIHIISVTLIIGVPFFQRYVLNTAAGNTLTDEQYAQLRERVNKRWRHIVYLLITLFILTGLFMFLVPMRVHGVLVTARWKDFSKQQQGVYHMIFGIKMLAAFGIFFLASALAGRTKTFAPIREKRKTYLAMLLVLAAIAVLCANLLRFLPANGPAAPVKIGEVQMGSK